MVSLLSTCLKYLPIAPLFMIMDCDFAFPKSFAFNRAKIWNDLSNDLKEESLLKRFI